MNWCLAARNNQCFYMWYPQQMLWPIILGCCQSLRSWSLITSGNSIIVINSCLDLQFLLIFCPTFFQLWIRLASLLKLRKIWFLLIHSLKYFVAVEINILHLIFIECLQYTSHFTYTASLNLYSQPMNYSSHFMEGMKYQSDKVIAWVYSPRI